MKNRSLIIITTLFFISLQGYAQKSQMKIAQNAVGKLQVAISNKQDKAKQLSIIGEGIKATESAQTDRRTRNWPETWAIKAYLSSYVSLIDENEANAEKYYSLAIESLDTAKKLDRFQNNTGLIDAANYNVILKKQYKGNLAYSNNEFQNAFNLLKEVSDFFPKDTTLAINTALSAQSINDYNNALNYFKQAKENGARNPILFQSIANIYTSKSEIDIAVRTLEEGLVINPYDTFLTSNYINLLIDNEKYEKAIHAIEKTLTVESKNKLLYFLYGYLQQQNSTYNTAELAYKRALAIDQNYFDALFQLGLTYVEIANSGLKSQDTLNHQKNFTSNINRAELALLQAHEINPNDKATVQLLIDIYTRKNRLDKVQELKRKLEEF